MPPRRQRFHASFCAWRESWYKKTQATEGVLGGHALSRRAFLQSHGSPQLHAVLEPCAVAAASERPGLEAADAALAAAVTELAEVVPDAHACKKRRVWLSAKRALVPWMLHRFWVGLSQCFWAIGQVSWVAGKPRCNNKACRDECWLPCFGCTCHLRQPLFEFVFWRSFVTRAFHGKFRWEGAVEVQLVSLLLQGRALSSASFVLRQLALNVCWRSKWCWASCCLVQVLLPFLQWLMQRGWARLSWMLVGFMNDHPLPLGSPFM